MTFSPRFILSCAYAAISCCVPWKNASFGSKTSTVWRYRLILPARKSERDL